MSRLEGLKKSVEDMPDTLLKADMKYLISRVDELEEHNEWLVDRLLNAEWENQELYESLKGE